MALQFVSGSLAACGAVTVTNPFDMLKTRRQLHNELGRPSVVVPPGPGPAGSSQKISLRAVWQAEGLRGLQKGLLPAYLYQILMNGTRFMLYEPVRLLLVRQTGLPSLLSNAAAGALAGGVAALIGSPFNLIKTRLQSHSPHFATGYQHGYAGLGEAVRRIGQAEGLAGFYRGVGASMSRTTAGSAAQLAAYDGTKPWIAQLLGVAATSFPVHLAAALTSGVLACLVMNPFDVVMTRLYNQRGSSLYAGLLDCARKTVRSEGGRALWKGLVPHFVRIGPHTVLTLVLLEQARMLLQPLF